METVERFTESQLQELDWPPDIDYETLARQAGYSEEEIAQMFDKPYQGPRAKPLDPTPLDPIFDTDVPF